MVANSEQVNPQLAGVPETLLIPLWARAMEQSRRDPLIVDPASAKIVQALNYDFDRFRRKRVETENFCVRSRVMDDVVSQILTARPGTTVVEFGPGLDTRFQRLGHLATNWLEVDLPEVIALRDRFFTPHAARRTVACSMLDEHWLDVCGSLCSEQPPLLIAEGVFYFFSDTEIRELLGAIGHRFPNSSFVFDAVSPWYLKFSNLRHPLTTSRLQFSLGPGAAEIPDWHSNWQIQQYVGYGDSPWYDSVMHRFPWWKRAAVRLLPVARHAFMIVHAAAKNDSPETNE
ncbi:MAG: class I SAM-dependent methyltransferase [Fuerstiella sp.]